MKKYASVFMLMCRRTVVGALIVSLASGIIQALAAYFAAGGSVFSQSAPWPLADDARLDLIAGAGLLALCVTLALVGCSRSSRQEYTLSRLGLTDFGCLACQWAANAIMLLIYLSALRLWALLILRVFSQGPADYAQEQTVMLALYRSKYLHSLVPLADWPRHIRVGAMLVSLAAGLACFPVRQRRGEKPIAAFFLLGLTLLGFCAEPASAGGDAALAVLCAVIAGAAVFGASGGSGEEERKNEA